MKMKRILKFIGLIVLLVAAGVVMLDKYLAFTSAQGISGSTTTTSVRFVNSTITADGTVTAESQASLNFQIPGKLVYLPFKEGDKVSQGQTIASLDTHTLKNQLQLASNAYQMSKNNTDQALENNQAGILEGQQRYSLDASNKQGYSTITESTVIYDAVQRIVDNDLLAKNSAQINVDLANYAMQLANLTSPINGIITHEAVTVSGINITPATTFTVADPDTMVFRANVPAVNIYYISEGSTVTLAIDGIQNKIQGTVVKIYPSKLTLPSGQAVYQVDIESDGLKNKAKLDEAGTAIISTNSENVALVPAWAVLTGKYIWIDNNGSPELRQITAGKIHGNEIEITKGLSLDDKIIIDPKFISSLKYKIL
jgi:RND family efflux transporter MFP subunit